MRLTPRISITWWVLTAVLCVGISRPAFAQFKEQAVEGFPLPTGQIAFARDLDLWIMNADGSDARELVSSGRVANRIEWSPDNEEILYCQAGMQQYELPGGGGGRIKLYDIFAVRLSSPTSIKAISQDAISAAPSYFPDGQRIAFTRNLHALDVHQEVPLFQVFVGGTYGTPEPQNLNKGEADTRVQFMTPAVAPDGKTVACVMTDAKTLASPRQSLGIVLLPATGDQGTVLEWQTRAEKIPAAMGPSWSPDGRFLAYVDMSTNPRSLGVYDFKRDVRSTLYQPLAGADLTTSPPGWSPDGNWLVFGDVRGNLQLVDRNGRNVRSVANRGSDAYPAFSKP